MALGRETARQSAPRGRPSAHKAQASRADQARPLIKLGKSNREIATFLKCPIQRVIDVRWRDANQKHYREQQNHRAARYRRANGMRPLQEHIRARQTNAAKRYAPVETLLAKKLSFTEAGAKLGMTKGQIAGIRFRARKQAERLARSNRAEGPPPASHKRPASHAPKQGASA